VQNPSEFFQEARAEYQNLPVWRGELYLEYHRGVYTSQARTKRGNRRSEALLREAELWSATAAVRAGAAYPHEELDDLWQQVLLHQFHDILPGTSIAWVHREAEAVYGKIHARLEAVIAQAAGALAGNTSQQVGGAGEIAAGASNGAGSDPAAAAVGAGGEARSGVSVLNAAAHDRREVVFLASEPAGDTVAQVLDDGRVAALAEVPALGLGALLPEVGEPVVATASDGGFVLANGIIEVRVDSDGLLRSVRDLALGRDAIAPGGAGNLLQLHRDQPNLWPAWNLERHYRNVRTDLTEGAVVTLVDDGPLVATVRVERSFGASYIGQDLRLTAGSRRLDVVTDIDWRERDAVLKSAWQLDVHAEHTAAEIQFGHVSRPTHENTSWDAARFEVYAHRWIHVGEHGWGTALITDSTYGYDASRLTRPEGGSTTTVRLTLLRAPNSPDPKADLGQHRFSYAVVPGADTRAALAEAHALNLPLRAVAAAPAASATPAASAGDGARPLVTVDNSDVVVEAVKLADDHSGDVVVRLYESRGGRATARLAVTFPVSAASVTDLLERPTDPATVEDGGLGLTLRPFQILTLRLTPGSSNG